MVREGTLEDIHLLLPLMKSFSQQLGGFYEENYKDKPIAHLLSKCITEGVLFVYEAGGEPVGLIGGILSRNMWNPSVIQIEEVAFYVHESHREGSAGGRLLLAYQNKIDDSGVSISTLKLLHNSPDIERHYEKLGYSKMETTYAKILGGE